MDKLWIHKLGLGELLLLNVIYVYWLIKFFPTIIAVSLFIATAGIIYFQLNNFNKYWENKGIPGPRGNILFGSTFDVIKFPYKFDKEQLEKHGRFFGTTMSGTRSLVINDLDLLKDILIKNFDAFPDRFNLLKPPESDIRSKLITVTEGDDWRRIRHKVTPAFTSGKIKKLLPAMQHCSEELIKYLDGFSASGEDVPLKEALSNYTMNIIGKAVFAIEMNAFDAKEKSPFLHFSKELFNFKFTNPEVLFVIFFPNLAAALCKFRGKTLIQAEAMDYYNQSLSDIMDQRLKDPNARNNYNDAFQLLLNAMDEKEKTQLVPGEDEDLISQIVSSNSSNKTLSRMEVLAQLITFLFAGYETTATTLHFICYVLSFKPQIQERMRDEIARVLSGRDHIEYEDMSKLQYLNQVIAETLRMYPPLIRNNRMCQKNVTVDGIDIERGTMVAFNIYNLHRDPVMFPDSDEFDPDRFTPENKELRHPMAYLPFGAGPRICLGMRFAEFEMRVALVDLIKNFKFTPADGMPGVNVDIEARELIKPVIDLKCRVQRI